MLLVALGITLAMVGATELMYRLGRARRSHHDESSRSQLSTVQAATLGLLALILGFTMSMAENRFSARRVTKVQEAGAVRATWLRSELLPEPERSRTRELIPAYVAARRDYYYASAEAAPAMTARSQVISAQLWHHAIEAGRAHPDWDILGTYLESLTDLIELEAVRELALAARLPTMIPILLVIIAIAAIGATGFVTGVSGSRNKVSLYIVPILVALTCIVIVDIDRSHFGVISATDAPMERVEQLIDKPRPAQATR
jgi:hypothetical protein